MTTTAPYGSWRSPISGSMLASSGIRLGGAVATEHAVYWLEGRPLEAGRNVIVRRDADGRAWDITPEGVNVRTLAHEYGGGAFWVKRDTVFSVNFADQRLYRQDGDGAPHPITPEPPAPLSLRYADGDLTPDGQLIVCVQEEHRDDGEVINRLVAFPADGSAAPRAIAEGHDFYSFPRVSPNGTRLAWTTWDHPNMPWDSVALWLADLAADGTLSNARQVAGGPEESIFQPAWSPDGTLHFVSDRTGWWNLYALRGDDAEPLAPMEAEFGVPQWVFGLSTYAFLPGGRVACIYGRSGIDHLGIIEPGSGTVREIPTRWTVLGDLVSDPAGNRLVFLGASATEAEAVIALDPASGEATVLKRGMSLDIDPGYLSEPRPIEFPTEGGLTAHAFYYPPANQDYTAPAGEKPPLLVFSHGGPTGQTDSSLSLRIQYWTSRGFAVVDVNYGGSTGYGREYRERLKGNWGIVDTADCVNAARYLVAQGEADGERLAIRGGSAGGYTTLACLAFYDVFAAGASYYGIGDLATMATDTHKFESRYLDGLVGPYPEAAATYRARSAQYHAGRITCPVILFQGLEDKVVPPSQAEAMVEVLAENNVPHAYVPFAGEQHGFRRAENIQRSTEAELYFYSRFFGFEPADDIEPVTIENL